MRKGLLIARMGANLFNWVYSMRETVCEPAGIPNLKQVLDGQYWDTPVLMSLLAKEVMEGLETPVLVSFLVNVRNQFQKSLFLPGPQKYDPKVRLDWE